MERKRRKPLRKYLLAEKKAKQVIEGSPSSAKVSSNSSKPCDDDEDWERIEKNAIKSRGGTSDDESSNSDGSEEEINLVGDVEQSPEQYNFDFNDMREEYATSIRTLLRSLIRNPSDAYTVADSIVEQELVGTAITCEKEIDVFAFATILPLSYIADSNPLATVINHLRDATSATTDDSRQFESKALVEMKKCLNSGSNTGILLNVRFSNLPMPLMSALHAQLLEDLIWAQKQPAGSSSSSTASPISGVVDFSTMTHVVALCSCNVSDKSAYTNDNHRVWEVTLSGNGRPSRSSGRSNDSGILFDQFEDEVYFQSARCAFLSRSTKTPEHTMCLASLLPITSLRSCVDKIKSMCGSA